MQVPSGTEYDKADLKILRRMVEVGFVRWNDKPFTLNSGIKSYVYVFGREDLTDHPDLEWMIGRRLAEVVYEHSFGLYGPSCLIGVPVAGGTLAQAAAMASVQIRAESNIPMDKICHRVMREQKKKHGAHMKWVNGDWDSYCRYWFVDNVVTNGDSKIAAADRAQEDGYPSRQMPCLILIDRQQGAVPRLKAAGFREVIVVYNLLDITHAFVQMDLWQESTAVAVEEEIKAHQFLVEPRAQT